MHRNNFLAWYELVTEVETAFANTNSVEVPKLYISGAEDHMFVNELIVDLSVDDNSELVILNQCGHVCNIEKADEFNRLSIDFMSKHRKKAKKVI